MCESFLDHCFGCRGIGVKIIRFVEDKFNGQDLS